ncbi:hypothetical protein MAP00_008414 [Monascus purpureus]|nr:hypothetical protein MAP00_008414 [Monascus purpureus]
MIRRDYLLNLITILKEMSPTIVTCLSTEAGKTLADAEAEIIRGLDSIQSACSVGQEMAGMYNMSETTQTYTLSEPLGVCVSITPFNFPLMIPLWSIPYALITGNTVVLKPSERAPTASMLLADAFRQIELPPGVFNVVHGGPSAVDKLLAQPSVQAVSFVGSDAAAERVYEHARATRKRVQAECGGKNHGIILEDANMTSTLYAIAGSAFGAAGQRCMAMSVAVFVGETKHWIQQLIGLASSLVVGCGTDKDVNVGPLISAVSKRNVLGIIERAVEEGATILLDGRDVHVPGYPNGNFVGPTILTDVKPYMECYQTEIFGPVLICMEVDTMEEAIELINENRYGNGCSIFTSSPQNVAAFQSRVNVGQIGVNIPIVAPSGMFVRTSNKDSFLGDMNVPGKTFWPFFTRIKTVTARW